MLHEFSRQGNVEAMLHEDHPLPPRRFAPPLCPGDLVAVFSKPRESDVERIAPGLVAWLEQRGFRVELDQSTALALGLEGGRRDWSDIQPRLAIVLGGDGTLLHVARRLRAGKVPLLAVNLGTLGFLTEVPVAELYANLESILEERCIYDVRTMVSAEVYRDGRPLAGYDALNDAVISKGSLARVIEFSISIDSEPVAYYRADGIIVATPTGSTAYSLSAGGPILHPTVDGLVITPICPHALTNRPLIVRDSAIIEITMHKVAEQTFLTMDGQEGLPLEVGDRIVCHKSLHQVTLVRHPQRQFFEVLRNKLKWG